MTAQIDVDIEIAKISAIEDVGPGSLDLIERLPVIAIPLNMLGPGFFLRQSGTDAAHVQLLADAASAGELPAILVQKSSMRVIDGMHRIEAARLRGERSISARAVDCSDEEAFILAVKTNSLHGLPLSRADRISGAKRILTWHRDWSDRAVAAATGLSAKTIAGLRHRSPDDGRDISKRLGRDGKRHPITAAEGRKRAAEYLTAHPDASLREVAREADVSLGTVHDVRTRLRRGIDPMVGARSAAARKPGDQDPPAASAQYRPSPDDATSLLARRRTTLPPTWAAISPKLAHDPCIRYSASGREFLRWMAMHVMHPGEWKEFSETVPAHWAEDISLIADSVADSWREFADHLRTSHRL
jgi:ParB-like chromosome segregation protein Spo0J